MLPTEKTPPKSDPSCSTILLYGPHKFGKSRWCAGADDALFLATEPGLNHLSTYQVPIQSWEKFLAACAELAEAKHSFRTVVVDTVDNAYRMCAEHVCKQQKITHESDLSYSKGYALVMNEFQRVVTKLTFLGLGIVFISHSQEKEIETRTGKIVKQVPSLSEKPRRFLTGLCDLVLFADFEPTTGPAGERFDRQVLRTKPSKLYDAGDRTGQLPDVLDFDYPTFVEAFRAAMAARDRPAGSGAPSASDVTAPQTSAPTPAAASPAAPQSSVRAASSSRTSATSSR